MNIDPDLIELYGPPMSVYTRADMLADGSLIEVPPRISRRAGWRVPLGVTAAAWAACVSRVHPVDDATGAHLPNEVFTGARLVAAARLLMAMKTAMATAAQITADNPRVTFTFRGIPRASATRQIEEIELIAHFGADLDGTLNITIMTPADD